MYICLLTLSANKFYGEFSICSLIHLISCYCCASRKFELENRCLIFSIRKLSSSKLVLFWSLTYECLHACINWERHALYYAKAEITTIHRCHYALTNTKVVNIDEFGLETWIWKYICAICFRVYILFGLWIQNQIKQANQNTQISHGWLWWNVHLLSLSFNPLPKILCWIC